MRVAEGRGTGGGGSLNTIGGRGKGESNGLGGEMRGKGKKGRRGGGSKGGGTENGEKTGIYRLSTQGE